MKNNIKYFLIIFLLLIVSCSNYKLVNPFGSDSNTSVDSETTVTEDDFISGPDATDFDIEYNMRMYKEKFGIYKIIVSGDISKTSTLTDVKKIIDKNYYKDAKAEIEVDLTKTTLTEIAADAFKDSITLKAIYLPADAASIKSAAFSGCTALSTVSLNDKLTTIEANAFNGCTALISISLPESLTDLEASSFDGCTELANLEYLGTETTTINTVSLTGVNKLINLYLPNVQKDPGDGSWDSFLGIKWTQKNYGSSIKK
ncbi:leucine-rich repeat domain-containing protein [Brachyspira hampsonii]|uniref:Cell surface protein n=1 Tax=Brachyspira hampsonii TaxID=1287055 RepID=A0AAC9TS68_9SPIR|nr:leucine-rich repeat domain-containing protein [Brachyspira hampsonii]ASJ20973.1 hypothetical protein BHAMNSH16_04665 [Brachyspira hampsonii]ELV06758.1 hypothetical protein H263_02175 [Brachyspira hampsonii 30599]MBW5379999.1 leucine-rich repeat domain-containing protein [Brachyspira hampsonii]MBW5410573.1 leucine-rich repeat domain-containing protein [Brachyspira hampsonii]OEJ13297.1 hypothetical protein A9496_02505 [Brachyspira hampsonii]